MKLLGISGLYHDSAAALIIDGTVVTAAQEERFTRKKNDKSFPKNAIDFCLRSNSISGEELNGVVFYDNPLLTLDRFLENCIYTGEKSTTLIQSQFTSMFKEKLWIHRSVRECLETYGLKAPLLVCEHHISHAAYSFYTSPYKEAAILITDGVGEWATTTLAVGRDSEIQILQQIEYPHSLGLLYSAFTHFCGFKVNSGEYKLMGLAPYGKPIYADLIKEHFITIRPDGSYKLNMEMFSYQFGEAMTDARFEAVFHCKRRNPEEPLHKMYLDIAASIQSVIEEAIIKLAQYLKELTGMQQLCLGGGVALNCSANGVLLQKGIFKDIYVPPAASDAGSCIGAALYAYYQYFHQERTIPEYSDRVYLGPQFSPELEKQVLDSYHAKYHLMPDAEALTNEIALQLKHQKIVGFFHGAMEFGPRALGNRSILASPLDLQMQSKLNLKIKYRESFRPFAPSVLEKYAKTYFELETPSPYMLFVVSVKNDIRYDVSTHYDSVLKEVNQVRSVIPSVTHVDYSARVQTVSEQNNPLYYRLIDKFRQLTGCAVLVNTSFNVRGEPIVCTPADAYECFMNTEMDILVIDSYILYKEEQDTDEQRWKKEFDPD